MTGVQTCALPIFEVAVVIGELFPVLKESVVDQVFLIHLRIIEVRAVDLVVLEQRQRFRGGIHLVRVADARHIPFARRRVVRPQWRQRLPEVGEGAVVELHARSTDRGLPGLVGVVVKCLGQSVYWVKPVFCITDV